jgi:heme exporter protein CcmD
MLTSKRTYNKTLIYTSFLLLDLAISARLKFNKTLRHCSMEKLIEALSMNGYAAFVWPAYGIAFFVVFFITFITLRNQSRAKVNLKNLHSLVHSDEA